MKSMFPPFLCLLLLTGVGAEQQWFHVPAAEVEAYHRSVRDQAEQLSSRLDDWVGVDVEVPVAAVTLLRPNAMVSRRYMNIRTGRHAQLLLVQCRDARDMLGHYPPVCYVSQGWQLHRSASRDWRIDDVEVPGREYEFIKAGVGRSGRVIIYHVLILPDGTLARDMAGVRASASHYTRRYLGAGQLQIMLDANVPVDERDEIFKQFLHGYQSIMQVIRSGGSQS